MTHLTALGRRVWTSRWRWAVLLVLVVMLWQFFNARPAQVAVATVQRGPMKLLIAASGKVDGDAADLSFTNTGKIVALPTIEGAPVEEGQILARLNYGGGSSADEVIQAPYAGHIVMIYRKLGAVISPGVPVLRVARRGGNYVTAYLDSEDAAWIKSGDRFTARAGGYLAREWTLQTQSVGREAVPRDDVEGSARQVRVRMSIGDGAFTLPLGTSLDIDGEVEIAHDSLQVPAAAVVRKNGRAFVWRVREGRANQVEIELGPNNFRNVVIETGLAEGDNVVVEGKTNLEEDQRIETTAWEEPRP